MKDREFLCRAGEVRGDAWESTPRVVPRSKAWTPTRRGALAWAAALALLPSAADAQHRRATREEIRLAVGETWRVSAARMRTYAESGPGVVEVGVSPDARWLRVRALRPGTNVVLVIYASGLQRSYTFVVTP